VVLGLLALALLAWRHAPRRMRFRLSRSDQLH
jgi:hypothetical protein